MKKQSTNLFTQISVEHLESLRAIVSETLATGLNPITHKNLTTAELWNIQRQGKKRVQRRMVFN
jgi:hypothetical protein